MGRTTLLRAVKRRSLVRVSGAQYALDARPPLFPHPCRGPPFWPASLGFFGNVVLPLWPMDSHQSRPFVADQQKKKNIVATAASRAKGGHFLNTIFWFFFRDFFLGLSNFVYYFWVNSLFSSSCFFFLTKLSSFSMSFKMFCKYTLVFNGFLLVLETRYYLLKYFIYSFWTIW